MNYKLTETEVNKLLKKEDWLRNVPVNIKKEVENLNLEITCLMGGEEHPCGVGTEWFIQKENKDKVKKLKELGWQQERGQFINGIKYTKFSKYFKGA